MSCHIISCHTGHKDKGKGSNHEDEDFYDGIVAEEWKEYQPAMLLHYIMI